MVVEPDVLARRVTFEQVAFFLRNNRIGRLQALRLLVREYTKELVAQVEIVPRSGSSAKGGARKR